MRLPPPDVVATWPPPNYTNPDTRGPALIIVELITLPVALICLGLRLYVRFVIVNQGHHWDDWMMVGGALFGVGVTTCVVLAFTQYGWDIHVWDLSMDKMIAGRQVSFAAQALFVPATCLAKISILVSYLRLAPRDSLFRRMTFAAIVFILVVNIAFFVVLFTQCIPLSSYWNLLRNGRDCLPEDRALLAQAITTAVCDFIVWVLPLPSLYQARLPLMQRLALITLFSFGLIVVFAACIRTYWIHYVVQETYDITWYGFHLWMWTAIEVQLGIICGCVPWLKSLFKFWRSRRSVIDITNKSGKMSGSRSDGLRTVTSKGGTVVRMDSLGKHSTFGERGRKGSGGEIYIDLERGPNAREPHVIEVFPDSPRESVREVQRGTLLTTPTDILRETPTDNLRGTPTTDAFEESPPDSPRGAPADGPGVTPSDISLSTSSSDTPLAMSTTIEKFPDLRHVLPTNTPGLAISC